MNCNLCTACSRGTIDYLTTGHLHLVGKLPPEFPEAHVAHDPRLNSDGSLGGLADGLPPSDSVHQRQNGVPPSTMGALQKARSLPPAPCRTSQLSSVPSWTGQGMRISGLPPRSRNFLFEKSACTSWISMLWCYDPEEPCCSTGAPICAHLAVVGAG